jgi:hypothetical protein
VLTPSVLRCHSDADRPDRGSDRRGDTRSLSDARLATLSDLLDRVVTDTARAAGDG